MTRSSCEKTTNSGLAENMIQGVGMNGWIKLHRELLDKAVWRCATVEQRCVLIAVLLMANHDQKQWIWNGVKYHCQPGEFITSQDSIATAACVSRQNVRSALKFLQKIDFLTIESNKQSTKLKINNWAEYQGTPNQEKTAEVNQDPTKGQPRGNQDPTTNKNDKNDKNNKNNITDAGASEDSTAPPKKKTVAPESREVVTYLSDALKAKGAREGQFSTQWAFAGFRVADQLLNAFSVEEVKQAITWLVNHEFYGVNIRSMTDVQRNITVWQRRNEPKQMKLPQGTALSGRDIVPAHLREGRSGKL